jgi:hypothetical protein
MCEQLQLAGRGMRDAGVGPSLQVLPVFEQGCKSGSEKNNSINIKLVEAMRYPFNKSKSVSPACRSPGAGDQQHETPRQRRPYHNQQ